MPFLVGLFFGVILFFGCWGFLRNWRFLAETQLRLNQCVGEVAHELRDTLNSLESSNQKIRIVRAAVAAAVVKPALIPSLKASIRMLVVYQEGLRLQWRVRQGRWVVSKGCGQWKDHASPLPTLDYQRGPEDVLGPQPLEWEGEMPENFYVSVSNKNRTAAANIQKGNDEYLEKSEWKASWCSPKGLRWTGIR